MKSLIQTITLTVALIMTQAMNANLAQAKGKGSGGGNGDSAFALQALVEANPGLSEEEILFQAFRESEGRLPALKFSVADGTFETARFLPSSDADNSYIIYLADVEGYRGRDFRVNELEAIRQKVTTGPLLGGQKAGPAFLRAKEYIPWPVPQLASPKGLIFKNHRKAIEFRQYNSKIVIYAEYPNSEGLCTIRFDQDDAYPRRAKDGICTIGYVWSSPSQSK